MLVHGEPGEGGDAQAEESGDLRGREPYRLDQRQHQRADADDQQRAAEPINAVLAALHPLVEKPRKHRDAERADRQIDPEHDRPMHMLDEKDAERRPHDRGDAEDARLQALHLGALGRQIHIPEDRHRDRLDRARA